MELPGYLNLTWMIWIPRWPSVSGSRLAWEGERGCESIPLDEESWAPRHRWIALTAGECMFPCLDDLLASLPCRIGVHIKTEKVILQSSGGHSYQGKIRAPSGDHVSQPVRTGTSPQQ